MIVPFILWLQSFLGVALVAAVTFSKHHQDDDHEVRSLEGADSDPPTCKNASAIQRMQSLHSHDRHCIVVRLATELPPLLHGPSEELSEDGQRGD
jgi:hypothetical protein